MNMCVDELKDIMLMLQNYFVYIYPGIISLAVFKFVRGCAVEENKNLLIKGIAISYLYVLTLQQFLQVDLNDAASIPLSFHAWLLLISVAVPYIWWKILSSNCFKCFLKKRGIDTNIEENPLDIIRQHESSVWLNVYLEDGVMYSGYLRNYVSELNRARYMMLSQYRVNRFDSTTNAYKMVYPRAGENESKKDWVILDRKKIIRIEVAFKNEH